MFLKSREILLKKGKKDNWKDVWTVLYAHSVTSELLLERKYYIHRCLGKTV